ncbi:MAG: hypothetical protein IKY21_03935 [Clostridia bacterium]|nr:hypothetical protein [Clostridia bacterium]
MLKFLFGVLTDPLGLSIDAIWEYLILAVIGAIAFGIAWNISPGGEFGSLIHWVVRLIAFVILWAIVYGIIALVQWIFANWILILCILGGVVVIGGIIAIIALRE